MSHGLIALVYRRGYNGYNSDVIATGLSGVDSQGKNIVEPIFRQ